MIRIVESGTDRVDDIVMEILKALPHRWTQDDLRALRTILPREFAAARRGAFEEAAEICDERAQKYRAFATKIEGVSAGQKELCKIRAETSDGNAAAIRERAKEDYAEREA